MIWWHRTRAAVGAIGATVVAALLVAAGLFGLFAISIGNGILDSGDAPSEATAIVAAGAFLGGCILLAGSLLGLLLYFATVWRGASRSVTHEPPRH